MSNPPVKLKLGVPVACLSEPSSPSCHLRIFKDRDNHNQITLALHIAATLQGTEEEQAFIVQYDGDNLQSGALDLEPLDIQSKVRDKIARHADPDFKTLTLCLRRPAPIWCPRDQALAPQANVESVTTFNEVVNLAKATAVNLVVDFKWLAPDEQSVIRHVVKGKGILAGFPSIPKYYMRYWARRDWTDFAPAAAPELPSKRSRPSEHTLTCRLEGLQLTIQASHPRPQPLLLLNACFLTTSTPLLPLWLPRRRPITPKQTLKPTSRLKQ
jgi:hypothetical protein